MATKKTAHVKVLVYYDEQFGEDASNRPVYVGIWDAAEVKFDVSLRAPKGAHDLAGMICSDLRPWLEEWKEKLLNSA